MILYAKSFSRTPARPAGGDPERKPRELLGFIPRIMLRIKKYIFH